MQAAHFIRLCKRTTGKAIYSCMQAKLNTGHLEGSKMDSLPVCLGEAAHCWGRNAGGFSSWGSGEREGWLLFYNPQRVFSLSIKASKRPASLKNVQIMTWRVFPPMSPSKTFMSECVHIFSLQTSHRGLVLWQGRWRGGGGREWGRVFFSGCGKWRRVLWPMFPVLL